MPHARLPGRLLSADGRERRAVIEVGLSLVELDARYGAWPEFGASNGTSPTRHWAWTTKALSIRGDPELVLAGTRLARGPKDWQGLALFNARDFSAREDGMKRILVLEYLAAAPWNERDRTDAPRFRGAGTGLLYAAVYESERRGLEGRVGLHALPPSEGFYRRFDWLRDFGPDPRKEGLRYFESEPIQYRELA